MRRTVIVNRILIRVDARPWFAWQGLTGDFDIAFDVYKRPTKYAEMVFVCSVLAEKNNAKVRMDAERQMEYEQSFADALMHNTAYYDLLKQEAQLLYKQGEPPCKPIPSHLTPPGRAEAQTTDGRQPPPYSAPSSS